MTSPLGVRPSPANNRGKSDIDYGYYGIRDGPVTPIGNPWGAKWSHNGHIVFANLPQPWDTDSHLQNAKRTLAMKKAINGLILCMHVNAVAIGVYLVTAVLT